MLQIICFSKDRPLQLHGFLTSLHTHLEGAARISVLVKIQPPYEEAYATIKSEFDNVEFVTETNFLNDLSGMMRGTELTCFCCDDVVFIRPVSVNDVEAVLTDDSLIGVSFRLGDSITRGMFGNTMNKPPFTEIGPRKSFIKWNMRDTTVEGDWGYPWDVLGTIYRTEFVAQMWPRLSGANNPSLLEDIGSRNWPHVTTQRHYASWQLPRTVVPTVNVVQDQFANGVIGNAALDANFLLDCWNRGLRLDVDRYTELWDSWRIGEFFLKRA